MKKEILRIVMLLLGLSVCMAGKAKGMPDSVVMNVAGKAIPLSEFIFIAQKNGEADFSSKKAIDEYVELFKNFKLKVAEAESQGMDKTETFNEELNQYRGQLMSDYLSDKDGEEAAARAIYDRGNEILEVRHILFPFPSGNVLLKDTLAVFQKANAIYERLMKGEDMDEVGKELRASDEEPVIYNYISGLTPMKLTTALENKIYSLPIGEISKPFRTGRGYNIAAVLSRRPNKGTVSVSHILIALEVEGKKRTKEEALKLANEMHQKAVNGQDFAELAKEYSDDSGSKEKGGELPPLTPGLADLSFEKAAFALNAPGDISPVVETSFGYHVIKLNSKTPRTSFEKEKRNLITTMSSGERNFELYKSFVDRMKKEYNYTFDPVAYKELEALCNDYFPSEKTFYEAAKDMNKTLFVFNGEIFPQSEFARYMVLQPFSTKTYGPDFMQEVFDLFIREIATKTERDNLEIKHPEFQSLLQEYRDGILLFEISSREIWNKPAEEQAGLETEWLKQLSKKYPVQINEKVISKLGK